jgi:hypothetical protein
VYMERWETPLIVLMINYSFGKWKTMINEICASTIRIIDKTHEHLNNLLSN